MNRNRTTIERAAAAEAALLWLELDKWPRLIVNGRLHVLWANGAVEHIVRASDEIEQRDGALYVGESSAQERLQKLVSPAGGSTWTLLVRGMDGDSHLLLKGRELGEHDGERMFGIQVMGAAELPPEGKADGHYDGIDEAFGLTRAEYRVLRSLIDGLTADEIAVAHRVAVDTVRSQIRGIYEKMHVSSREGLFSRIRPFGY